VKAGQLNAVPEGGISVSAKAVGSAGSAASADPEVKFCKIDNPECEACQ
jgi:hypothetical protein